MLVADHGALRERLAAEFAVSPKVHADDMLWRFVLGFPGFADPEQAVRYYFEDGAESARKLRAIVETSRGDAAGYSLLEFASGYGMVTRHLRNALPGAEVLSCDIHPAALEFIESNLATPTVLSADQPEECRFARRFDVVFALSFFSHMPPTTFGRWLATLFDAVAPNGILIFTTHGLASAPSLGNPEIPPSGSWFKPESEQLDLDSASYGSALTTPSYVVRELFRATRAPLMDFQQAHWWGHQDLYVVSRPPGSATEPPPG
jgi:SAM-dependent methyltransferase